MKDPYDVVKRHYVTEKAKMLEGLSLGDGEGKRKAVSAKILSTHLLLLGTPRSL